MKVLVINGTPLYFFTMSGLLKNMLDRTIPLALPFMEENENGITTHLGRYDNKKRKILLVSPCGFPEMTHFDSLIATFKQIAKMSNLEYLGEIVRPSAGLMFVEDLQDKIKPYFNFLEQAGTQLIEKNRIDQKTHQALHEEWISPEEFRERANEYFKSELEKIEISHE